LSYSWGIHKNKSRTARSTDIPSPKESLPFGAINKIMDIKSPTRTLIRSILALLILLSASTVQADVEVHVGVLAHRGIAKAT